MFARGRILATALVLLVVPDPARGQVTALRLRSDNDAYRFWVPADVRPDREYTNGLEVDAELAGAHLWGTLLPHAPGCPAEAPRCASTTLSFGQKIFTPRVDSPRRAPGDRPYAGWLYAGLSGATASERDRRALALEVGVTGGPSGAGWVQTTLHRAFGFWRPSGWDGQIPFEPAGVLRYDQQRLVRSPGRAVELIPSVGASLGTLRTEARGGLRARVGFRLDDPWPMPAAARRHALSLYGIGEVRGRAVARDLFLDGGTFRRGPHVTRVPLVGEWEAGLGLRVHRVVAEYRIATRTREYRTEPGGHQYATIDLTIRR